MEFFKYYMVREPILNLKKLKEIEQLNMNNKSYLKKLIQFIIKEDLKASLYYSNKSLYYTIENFEDNWSEKKVRNTVITLRNYLYRMVLRPTPFGLLSTINVNEINSVKENNSDNNIENFCSLDNFLLYKIIYTVHDNDNFNKDLYIETNPHIYFDETHYYIPYQNKYSQNHKDNENNNIGFKKTLLLSKIIDLLNNGKMKFSTLTELISKEYEVSESDVNNFIKTLLHENLLYSDIGKLAASNDTLNDLTDLMQKKQSLKKSDIYKLLKKIKEYKYKIENSRNWDSILAYLKEIDSKVTSTFSDFKKCTFKIDSKKLNNNNITLCNEDLKNIEKVFYLYSNFNYITSNSLEEYKNRFLEIYGQNEDVNVIELLNPNIGLGFPKKIEGVKNSDAFGKIKSMIMDWESQAIVNGEDVILKEDHLKLINDLSINKSKPIGMDLYFTISKLQNGDNEITINNNSGSQKPGNVYGRFLYILSEKFKKDLETFSDYSNSDIFQPEIIFDCPNPIVQNVKFNGNPTNKIDTISNANCINIKDIYIYLSKDLNFYLKDSNSGKIIIPKISDMHNTEYSPNLIDFLMKIVSQYNNHWLNITTFEEDFIYSPRVKYKNIVLSPKTWKIFIDNPKNLNDFKEDFLTKKRKYKIPDHFYIVLYDSKLYINTNENISFEIMKKEIKKSEYLTIMELENELMNNNKISEFVFTAKKNYSINDEVLLENRNTLELRNQKEILHPGSDWISIKLYYNEYKLNDLLGYVFANEIFKKYKCPYFIRYVEDAPQIRLRMKIDNDDMNHIIQLVKSWINRNYIKHFEIVPYYREVNRYGGPESIDFAEKCFSIDSLLSSSFFLENYSNQDKEEFGLLNIIDILVNLCDSLYDIKYVLENFPYDRTNKDLYRKVKPTLLSLVKNYREKLDEYNLKGERDSFYNNFKQSISSKNIYIRREIILSMIHMFCNRFFGVDRNYEMYIMEMLHRSVSDYIKEEEYKRRGQ